MSPVTRRVRHLAALVAIAGLLFSQMAVSAFACPMIGASAAVVESPCDEAMKANANLCDQHCEYGQASVETSKSPSPPADLAGPVFRIRATAPEQPRQLVDASRVSASGPAPPLSRFTVLRI